MTNETTRTDPTGTDSASETTSATPPEQPNAPTQPTTPESPSQSEPPKEPESPEKPEEPEMVGRAELERIRSERPRVHEAHVRQSDNRGPDTTATLEPLAHADPEMWLGTNGDPDVLVSIPNLGVDRIYLGIDNLRARVDLHAKVLDLLELSVGAEVSVDKVELEIDNVRVQAMVKVRLEEVRGIVGEVVGLLDHHPEILTSLTGGLGRGLEGALAGTPEKIRTLNETAPEAELTKPKSDAPDGTQ